MAFWKTKIYTFFSCKCEPVYIHTVCSLYMVLPYVIKTLDIIAFLSEWGSFKKCLVNYA